MSLKSEVKMIVKKPDEIMLTVTGHKKFRQYVIDKIVEMIQSEDFAEHSVKPGCGVRLESTIAPSE